MGIDSMQHPWIERLAVVVVPFVGDLMAHLVFLGMVRAEIIAVHPQVAMGFESAIQKASLEHYFVA